MRHRIAGKRLGRRKEERVALARNLTAALFEQFGQEKREYIFTTRTKAKWVRPFVERCITLGVRGHRELKKAADAQGVTIEELKKMQTGPERTKFAQLAPKTREHLTKSIHYRRMLVSKLRRPEVVTKLFDEIAPRYLNRPGGYLRVLHTDKVALGDASPRSLLGFVEAGS
ncbi:MAG: bL17 family ribosomal protein [Planctomycetota bacterium]